MYIAIAFGRVGIGSNGTQAVSRLKKVSYNLDITKVKVYQVTGKAKTVKYVIA